MSNVAYITEHRSDGVMAGLGLDVYSASVKKDFKQLIRELIYKQYVIIFVSETVYREHETVINEYNHDFSVSIVVLANQLHHHHLGSKRLKAIIEDAIGVSVGQEG